MSSVVPHPSNKRSISSTIANFFKKETPADYHPSTAKDKPSNITANFEDADTTELPSVPDLILYDSFDGERPPLLPIMPLQRLKILRHKQYLRRMEDSHLPSHLGPMSANGSEMSNLSQSQLLPLRVLKRNASQAATRQPRSTKSKSVLGKRWSGDFEYDLAEYDVVKKPKNSKTQGSSDVNTLESPRLSPAVLKKGTMGGKQSISAGLSSTQASLLNGKAIADQPLNEGGIRIKPAVREVSESEKPTKPLLALPSSGFDFVQPGTDKTADTTNVNDANTNKPIFAFSKPSENNTAETKKPFSFGQTDAPINATNDRNENQEQPSEKSKPPFALGGTTEKKPAFSFGKSNDDSTSKAAPFSFGKANEDSTSKSTSFSFGMPAKTPNGDKNIQTSIKFGDSDSKIGNDSKQDSDRAKIPSFTFKAPPQASEPVSSINGTAENKKDDASATEKSEAASSNGGQATSKPALDLGLKTSEKPAFNFGSKPFLPGVDSKSETPTSPAFSFGATGGVKSFTQQNKDKDDTTASQDDPSKKKSTFAFGVPQDNPSDAKNLTPSFSFGLSGAVTNKPQVETKLSSGAGQAPNPSAAAKEGGALTPSFSFKSSSGHEQTSKPSITTAKSFDLGATADKKAQTPPPFSFGNSTKASTQSSSSNFLGGGFKFDTNGLNPGANSTIPPKPALNNGSSSDVSKPTFSFGNAPASVVAAPQPQSALPSAMPPSQNAGFTFGSGSTTNNNSPAFGNTNNNQQLGFNFGTDNRTASSTPPPFGNLAVPGYAQPQPQSRPFSPSHTVNLNFGGSGSQPPSSIFGGTGNSTPAQIFGGQNNGIGQGFSNAPSSSSIFGGVSAGQAPQQQAQTPMLNLPPGRKLARMRSRRN
ncbi:LADA_0E08702g1_1 [Lachancea dasiensis]|uniref:LADA_0E08702g1_1 n=1 Tax=Lachancea dasiensis TaxID=1072105 RepID=A0A1G4JE38_9SACH|nr:LADA_0E08702g1_1 [Lachancea dasiensis]